MDLEWLILADAAQVVGGKLYLIGGGWDVLTVNQSFPSARHCAVAVSFRIPWNETNQKHNVEIEIVSEDGDKQLTKIAGQVEAGRPAGLPPGQDQRAQLAAEMTLQFPEPGAFAVFARIEGQDVGRTPFRVVAGPNVLRKGKLS
jgi:hypothetical protein